MHATPTEITLSGMLALSWPPPACTWRNFGTAIGPLPRLLTMPNSSSMMRPSKRLPSGMLLSLERSRANA